MEAYEYTHLYHIFIFFLVLSSFCMAVESESGFMSGIFLFIGIPGTIITAILQNFGFLTLLIILALMTTPIFGALVKEWRRGRKREACREKAAAFLPDADAKAISIVAEKMALGEKMDIFSWNGFQLVQNELEDERVLYDSRKDNDSGLSISQRQFDEWARLSLRIDDLGVTLSRNGEQHVNRLTRFGWIMIDTFVQKGLLVLTLCRQGEVMIVKLECEKSEPEISDQNTLSDPSPSAKVIAIQ